MTKEELLKEAMRLQPMDRVRLADGLYESVDLTDGKDIEASWVAEIRRRASEIDLGTVQLIDQKQAMQQMFGDDDHV